MEKFEKIESIFLELDDEESAKIIGGARGWWAILNDLGNAFNSISSTLGY
ncbi:hypothetical protein [Streptococcus suis]|nr:hypothetical protein [Streptococcus suis]MDW8709788.1 hypothetical protein [Streptococcus suis]NQG42462.1 hypothetical protein [Streptococcus suis]CYV65630.1 Uncharacterised protein [Streptococcus suis]HEL2220753.1 hypothetical protein [Streptococcus suis]